MNDENKPNLALLFKSWTELDKPPIIELQNINHVPVGALYLDKIKYENIIISETKTQEKYFLYLEGIAIYFSYYKRINRA